MDNFYISTDSTCDLFVDEVKQMGLDYLPLTLTVEQNGIHFVDDNFTEYQQYVNFYNLLRKAIPVKTSMNNFEKHREYFASLAEQGHNNVIHFTISYGLAPTMDVANQAIEEVKKQYPNFCAKVIESHTTTVGQGMLVKIAYDMQQNGKTMQETVDYVQNIKHHIQHYVIVDDLFHLKRGGRVSGAAAMIGTAIQLKVVLTFDKEGKLKVIKKVIGGRKNAIKAIIAEGKKFTLAKDNRMVVVHTDNVLGANELASALELEYKFRPPIRIMGPTIGCHVGPNAIAYIFLSEQERR